jgi:hypothetical protein
VDWGVLAFQQENIPVYIPLYMWCIMGIKQPVKNYQVMMHAWYTRGKIHILTVYYRYIRLWAIDETKPADK